MVTNWMVALRTEQKYKIPSRMCVSRCTYCKQFIVNVAIAVDLALNSLYIATSTNAGARRRAGLALLKFTVCVPILEVQTIATKCS